MFSSLTIPSWINLIIYSQQMIYCLRIFPSVCPSACWVCVWTWACVCVCVYTGMPVPQVLPSAAEVPRASEGFQPQELLQGTAQSRPRQCPQNQPPQLNFHGCLPWAAHQRRPPAGEWNPGLSRPCLLWHVQAHHCVASGPLQRRPGAVRGYNP